MAELLKQRYSKAYVERLAAALVQVDPRIDAAAFVRAVRGRGWNGLELKQRMRRIAECLHAHVPGDYRAKLATVRRVAPGFGGFEAMFFPDFVERYGLDDFDASIEALEDLTRYSSSEFAVRPFIVRYGDRMLRVLARWARHDSEYLRRLASEGSRPRLPWSMRLPRFVADPAPVLAILERLKDDPSDYVRRSVANSLNDVAKDHPDAVLAVAQRWLGRSLHTDALVKHACRTLLKRGDPRALRLFGHHDGVAVEVRGFRLGAARLAIGEELTFDFALRLQQSEPAKLRIEYAVDFVKANGGSSRKLFKIAERRLEPGTTLRVARRHRFRDLTTRKHYTGTHRVAVVVNGVERAARSVRLAAARR